MKIHLEIANWRIWFWSWYLFLAMALCATADLKHWTRPPIIGLLVSACVTLGEWRKEKQIKEAA